MYSMYLWGHLYYMFLKCMQNDSAIAGKCVSVYAYVYKMTCMCACMWKRLLCFLCLMTRKASRVRRRYTGKNREYG